MRVRVEGEGDLRLVPLELLEARACRARVDGDEGRWPLAHEELLEAREVEVLGANGVGYLRFTS